MVVRSGGGGDREPAQTQECATWMVGVLEEAGEPLAPKVVYAMGEEAGLKHGVVHLARRELEGVVVHTATKTSRRNRWALAEGDPDCRARWMTAERDKVRREGAKDWGW